jgi:hypothetical protein
VSTNQNWPTFQGRSLFPSSGRLQTRLMAREDFIIIHVAVKVLNHMKMSVVSLLGSNIMRNVGRRQRFGENILPHLQESAYVYKSTRLYNPGNLYTTDFLLNITF